MTLEACFIRSTSEGSGCRRGNYDWGRRLHKNGACSLYSHAQAGAKSKFVEDGNSIARMQSATKSGPWKEAACGAVSVQQLGCSSGAGCSWSEGAFITSMSWRTRPEFTTSYDSRPGFAKTTSCPLGTEGSDAGGWVV